MAEGLPGQGKLPEILNTRPELSRRPTQRTLKPALIASDQHVRREQGRAVNSISPTGRGKSTIAALKSRARPPAGS
jgi:hypothetical protein